VFYLVSKRERKKERKKERKNKRKIMNYKIVSFRLMLYCIYLYMYCITLLVVIISGVRKVVTRF
jgi:hypothetical protein